MKKNLKIFLINYDWRDVFRTSFIELREKLARDRLGPEENEFLFYSFSNVSYENMEGRYKTIHRKTRIYKIKPFLDLIAIFLIVNSVRRSGFRPDAWLTYDFGMLPALWLARLIYGGKIVLCVSNQPSVYSRTRRWGIIKGVYSWLSERFWWRLADHFFTINETMREYLKNIGIPGSRISVFYVDTIDRDRPYIGMAQRGVVKKKYKLGPDRKIILTVARLESEKNHSELIELFSRLGPDFVLIIVGRGSLLPELKKQVKELGIEDKVIFTGYVHRDQIWNYYLDADVFVLLSKAEALGLVFWEAMYMGIPVIGSTADGILETIGDDRERGRIWRSDLRQEDFNGMIRFCLDDSGDRNAMLRRAREFVDRQRKNAVTFNDLPIF